MTHRGGASTLKARLQADLTEAIRSRDDVRSATLRLALTAWRTEEVAGSQARELDDAEVIAVLGREAKKRREAAEAFDGAARPDRADRERAELAVLVAYLPAQLDDDALAAVIAEEIAAAAATGATGMAAMGRVMKAVQTRVAGRADGARVAADVRRRLSGPTVTE